MPCFHTHRPLIGVVSSREDIRMMLNQTYLDAPFSMAFCYEELGNYRQAHKCWTELIAELDRRGLAIERKLPAQRAEACLKMLREQ